MKILRFEKMKRQFITAATIMGLLVVGMGLSQCGSSSSNDSDSGSTGTSGTDSFSSGGVSLSAVTTESGGTQTATVTQDSETVVTVALTTTGATLTIPGQTDTVTISFSEELGSQPSAYAANMLATYISGFLLENSGTTFSSLRADNPGCDWFPDTQCTLGCCADHDRCFSANSCGASSWLPGVGSAACNNCNSIAAACISRACSGIDSTRTTDRCYDARCNEFYDCDDADCTCASPCDDTSPSDCGNGTCNVDEDSSNCPGDCVQGAGINQCCSANDGCLSETATTCPGSCCCCGIGEVCSLSTNLCAAASLSSLSVDTNSLPKCAKKKLAN